MAQPGHATTAAAVTIDATEDEACVPVLRVAGEVDLATIGCVRDAIARHSHRHALVIDLTAVTFFAVCGVDLLLKTAARMPVRVVADSRAVLRVLTASGVDGQLRHDASVVDAVAHFCA